MRVCRGAEKIEGKRENRSRREECSQTLVRRVLRDFSIANDVASLGIMSREKRPVQMEGKR